MNLIRTLTAGITLGSLPYAQAPCEWLPAQQLVPESGYVGNPNYFARSSSLEGDVVLIGAPGLESSPGQAFVFENGPEGWVEQATFEAGDSQPENDFGISVALSGTRALIGAPGALDGRGVAYVFERSGTEWIETAVLVTPVLDESGEFGSSVSLQGDLAMIGAPDLEAVYVFEAVAGVWSLQQTLRPSLATAEEFGASIVLDGERMAVGDPEGAAAYMFRSVNGIWVEEAVFTSADASADFGAALSLAGNVLMVGAPGIGADVGEVHVYSFYAASWSLTQVLVPSVPIHEAEFGAAVAHSEGTALIGAPREGEGLGSAYLYTWEGTQWVEVERLTPGLEEEEYNFGTSVAVDGPVAMVNVGLDQAGVLAAYAGSLYVWSQSAVGCPELWAYPPALSLQQGGQQGLSLAFGEEHAFRPYLIVGSLSGAEPGVVLDGVHVPLNLDAYSLLTVANQNDGTFQSFFGLLDSSGSAAGTLNLQSDLPVSLAGLVLHHAPLVFDPATSWVLASGNATTLELQL